MKKEPRFLQVSDIQKIHARMIADFGGTCELRDKGLLESAAGMPSAQFGGQYLHDGFAAMAAAYLFHICKNHAFVDGNKRTALTSAELFLELNGYTFAASNDEMVEITLGVADSTISKDELTKMLKKIVKPIRKK